MRKHACISCILLQLPTRLLELFTLKLQLPVRALLKLPQLDSILGVLDFRLSDFI